MNARGIASDKKRRALFDFHRVNVDILIILETHSNPNCETIWENEWGGKAIYAHGTSASKGVAIFTSKGIYKKCVNTIKDIQGRYIIFDLVEDEHIATFVAIYAPNQDDPQFYIEIAKELRNRQEHKIIVGDFNLTLDVELDRLNTYCNNNKARDEVLGMMEEFNLKDIWRVRNPEKREYSWIKNTQRSVERKASRIDFVLISSGLDQKVEMIMYLSSIQTDHRATYIVVEFEPNERGAGYWKMNTSILHNADFLKLMEEELRSSINSSINKKPTELWEILKERIKKTTQRFTRENKSKEKLIIGQLSEKVNEYEERLPLQEDEDKLYMDTKAELEELVMERITGVMFRCKANWYELGERNTKYFYTLEKEKYNAKTCYKMINEDTGNILSKHSIIEYQRQYYQTLYSEDKDVEFNMSNTYGIKVPSGIKEQQEVQLTLGNLAEAVKDMNNNKTPGSDGIPVDFYKVFWRILREPLYNMMVEVYSEGILLPSMREGILNLIPKANKDTRRIKNLRPITLLNTDYKIIEKAVANKMLPALKTIINRDQRGFMKERRISVNIRKMLDIIHYAEKEDLEAVILSLDFVKCFDKCSFSILHGSLDFFNFGKIVKDWTQILYKDFSVKIQNNGNFSTPIDIHKGVHQGGCCSSVYFLVIAEILALALRNNEDIEGISIRNIRSLLNQFADDMDVFSLCTEKSVRAICNELDQFRFQSGFTVSYDKTTLYRIGSLRHTNARMYDIDQYNWSNNDINVLGVTIAHEDVISKNYSDIEQKVEKILKAWYNRGLSLIGKVQVINTLIASLFVYKMMVLPTIPDTVVKRVDNLIRDYLWNGRKSKISYTIMQNPKDHGGLKLVNLKKKDKALKATWPQILSNEPDYAEVVYHLMRCTVIGEDIWRVSLTPQDVNNMRSMPQFWKDVLLAWSEINCYYNKRIENQLVWYNSEIRVKNKPVMWNDAYLAGLKYVHQLFDRGEFKTCEQINQEYGLSVMRYNSLKVAIPAEWKDFFKETDKGCFCPLPPHNYDKCLYVYGRSWSRQVYNLLLDDVMLMHNKYLKWKQDLGSHDISDGLSGNLQNMHKDVYSGHKCG